MALSRRKTIMDMVMIDLHDYEGALLLQLDRGIGLMPPAPMPGGVDYDKLKPSDMKRIERNHRVAREIYKRLKEVKK